MSESSNTKEPGDAQAVSIAGGSLFLIGFMLWFFTSGIKSEVKSLRSEMRQVQEALEKQGKALQKLSSEADASKTSDK